MAAAVAALATPTGLAQRTSSSSSFQPAHAQDVPVELDSTDFMLERALSSRRTSEAVVTPSSNMRDRAPIVNTHHNLKERLERSDLFWAFSPS